MESLWQEIQQFESPPRDRIHLAFIVNKVGRK